VIVNISRTLKASKSVSEVSSHTKVSAGEKSDLCQQQYEITSPFNFESYICERYKNRIYLCKWYNNQVFFVY